MPAAKWTVGKPTANVDATSGTATASVPLLDNGVLACTLTFTMTAGHALEVRCTNQPGTAGLSDFTAWEV